MSRITHKLICTSALVSCLFWAAGAIAATSVHIQSTWDGSTNIWTSTSNWLHTPPSLLGYPWNGLHPFGSTNVVQMDETYNVHLPNGRVELLGQPIRVNDLTISGGQHYLWNLTLNNLAISGGGSVLGNITASNLIVSGGTNSLGVSTISNQFLWMGGDVQSDSLKVSDGIHITGPTSRRFNGVLQSHGNGLVEGPVNIQTGERWDHYGALEIRGHCWFTNDGSWGFIRNYGAFVKSGEGDAVFERHFESHGSTRVQAGTLQFPSDGAFSGELRIDPDARLVLNARLYAASNAIVHGPGTIEIREIPRPFGYRPSLGLAGNGRFVLLSNTHVQIFDAGQLGNFNGGGNTLTGGILIAANSTVSVARTNSEFDPYKPAIGPGVTNAGNITINVNGAMGLDIVNKHTVEIRSDCRLLGKVDNQGTILKSAGPGISYWGYSDFDSYAQPSLNSGLVWSQQGTFQGPSFFTNRGTFLADAGAVIRIGSERVYLDGGTLFMGDGRHEVSRAQVLGAVTNQSDLHVGRISGSGTLFNETNGILTLDSEQASVEATVINQGLAVASTRSDFWWPSLWLTDFRNEGIFEWLTGSLNGAIHNHGYIFKNSTNDFMLRDAILENHSVIEFNAGTVTFLNSFTNEGALIINSNATTLVRSNLVHVPGAQLVGTGKLVVEGSVFDSAQMVIDTILTNHIPTVVHASTLNARSNYTIGSRLTLSNATLTGPGNIFVLSNAVVMKFAGTDTAGGAWRIDQGGTLAIRGESSDAYLGRDVENDGLIRVENGMRLNSTIRNRGYAELRANVSGISPKAAILNDGHMVFTAGVSYFSRTFPNQVGLTNRGVMEVQGIVNVHSPFDFTTNPIVQTAGELRLNNGALVAGTEIRGGALTGNGTNDGYVRLFGTMSPGPTFGNIQITDRLFLASGSTIEFDLGGTNTGAFDRINVKWDVWCSNNVTFVVRLANGFMPQVGDRFEVMKFYWSSPFYGPFNFPKFKGLTLSNGLRLTPILTFTNLTFVATAAPNPENMALRITRGQYGSVYLHWPPEFAGFLLQYSTNLLSPWQNVSITSSTNRGWSPFSPETSREVYFRLLDPEIHE